MKKSSKSKELYSHEKKVKLANRISKIKKKSDLVKIFEIIYEDNQSLTENKNGIFMYFNKLNNETYYKLDAYLKCINKKENFYTESVSSPCYQEISEDGNKESIQLSQHSYDELSENSSTTDYKPYTKDEFPSQKGISPKFKYSNREKNLLKRKRYDTTINSKTDDIMYCEFDVNNITESDVNASESNKEKTKQVQN